MPVEIIMPKVDMDMTTGKIAAWHAADGDAIEKGAPLFDIETDKAAMEVEALDSGLLRFPLPEGSEVPIGQPIGWLYAENEAAEAPPAAPAMSAAGMEARPETTDIARNKATDPAAEAAPAQTERTAKNRATPLARRLARDGGLDIDALAGSGPRGRVQAEDVRAALESRIYAAPAGFAEERGPLAVTRSPGGTDTPVLLIHGFADEASSWALVEPHLKRNPLFRIDLPCHGKSPRMRFSGFGALAAELRGTFDSLHLDEVHLVGHSLGGALALALADVRPRKVVALSLIAPAGLGPDINGAALDGICRATREASLGPWLRTLVADEMLVTDAYVRGVMSGRRDPGFRAAQTAMANTLFPDGVQAFDLRAAFDRLEVPTRIIWGKSDSVIPWRHALEAPGRVALHFFENVGHMPQIEIPDEVGALLARVG